MRVEWSPRAITTAARFLDDLITIDRVDRVGGA
jgi:hypothetical protein